MRPKTGPGYEFIGRRHEMEELQSALEDALAGNGRLVMLAGEPGIGKTRTAQEIVSLAEARGARSFWGWCYEEEGSPPYWPWVQPIRSYLQALDQEHLRAEIGPGAEDIAGIIPELRERLPGLESLPNLEPVQARFRLFDSITAFLAALAARRPLVLVLDDLHWADRPSLLLLDFLARQIAQSKILLLGCYRDVELSRQHALSESLSRISREPSFRRLELRGLHRADTQRFVEIATGRDGPPPELVEAIHSQTEGNPFFTGEVIRLLSDLGELAAEAGVTARTVRIPAGVREVIGQRLNRMSEACNRVLTTASVVGREFDFRVLAHLQPELFENQLLGIVDEAAEARLIEELPGEADRYRFSHALIQQTLCSELTKSRKARLHAVIAQALEEIYGDEVGTHAAELAYHFGQAQTVVGTEKLVRYSLVAGERALAAHAYEDAQIHFQRALDSKLGDAPDTQMGQLLAGKGHAEVATSPQYELASAVDTLNQAFEVFLESGDVDNAVAVAEVPLPPTAGYSTGMSRLIFRALDLVPSDSLQAARLLGSYGRAVGLEEGDYGAARQAFDRALEISQKEGDSGLELRTRSFDCDVHLYHGRFEELLRSGLQGVANAAQVDDPRAETLVRILSATVFVLWGRRPEALEHIIAGLAAAERLRHHFYSARTLFIAQCERQLSGDWLKAREFSDRGLAVSPNEFRLLTIRSLVEFELGNLDLAKSYMDRLEEAVRLIPPGPTYAHTLLASLAPVGTHIAGRDQGMATGIWASEIVLDSPSATPLMSVNARVAPAMFAVREGDATLAQEQYEAITTTPGADLMMLQGILPQHLLGLLAGTMGDYVLAEQHFEQAFDFSRKAGYQPRLAWACCDYGDLLLRRDGPGDRLRASSLLEEGLFLATELGMRPLAERILLLQQSEPQPAGAPGYPAGLSVREVEVLRFIALGMTSREIAAELTISLNTVNHHVSNILNKTGAANRAEAVAYAAQHGLSNISPQPR